MLPKPENVRTIEMASCVMHNLLISRYPNLVVRNVDREDGRHYYVAGQWRRDTDVLHGPLSAGRNTSYKEGKDLRQYLRRYYSTSIGKVAW